MTATPQYVIQKRYLLRKMRGETAYIDATPTRNHIASLRAAGWSLRAIAGTAGLSSSTVSNLARTVTPTCAPDTAARILAINADTIPATSAGTTDPFVARVGTTRRLQALLAIGWTHQTMREHSGLQTASLLHQKGNWVTRSTHDTVAAMYRDLTARPGPSPRTAARARRLGYASPLSWHDIDHDEAPEHDDHEDSNAYLDEVAIQRRMNGDQAVPLTKAEQAALIHAWAATGRTAAECERVTGVNVHRVRREHAA